MPKGYPKKKEIAVNAPVDNAENVQVLLDRIAELERDKADLVRTQVDAEPTDAMAYLMKQNAEMMKALGNVVASHKPPPDKLKSRSSATASPPYVLTDERKEQVAAIFANYAGKVEYSFDKSGSVTFRKKIKVRVYDNETEQWTREDSWKSESVHCSSADSTINKLVKFMVLV